jgi:hypothetical protein
MTHFSGARQAVAALAITLVAALSASAQSGTVNLTNRTLQRTTFQAGSGAPLQPICSTQRCGAKVIAFTRPIGCPVSAGKTCTFYLHLESQIAVTPWDLAYLRFLVDGATPVPRQTDPDGYVFIVSSDPNSGAFVARSYAVIAKVKNTTANQLHSIEVDIGCDDLTDDGCFAVMDGRTLSTGVYTP